MEQLQSADCTRGSECRPVGEHRIRRGRGFVALIAVGLALGGAGAASAANNPGTGDSGFFTFRPSVGVGGTLINVASGNALVRTRDLADGPLTYHVVVDRFYNSLDPDNYTVLSPRWGFDVGPDTKLTVESNQDATVRGPSGYRIRFVRQADGSYVVPEGFDGSLVKTPSGWTLSRTSASDEFGFDGSGNLTWTKDSSLRDFTVQGTSAAGRTVLSSYGTNSGRRVNLSYATSGDYFVRLMDDPASGHHWYRYTGGRLSEYESPTGAITSYGYDASGFLDEIVEPGGTTVELDVSPAGRIHAITTALPGGVPQTTSFVYTRRAYKTDVTAPDTTRRTYAYDDDWRVTRDYDPDVVPTVTASGELHDLADDYVGPNRTYPLTVAADQPDGAGLRRLLVERSNGTEIEGEDVPCTTTPFDLVCPTNRTTNLDVSFANVPEGEQTIRAAADDDEEHHATSDGWNVLVDKTPPTAASDFQLSYVNPSDPTASATITWEMPEDPDLPGDIPGSGIAKTELRYRIDSGAWSAWQDSNAPDAPGVDENPVGDGDLILMGGESGDVVSLEVRATDAVGNLSGVAAGSVTLVERLEDPVLEDIQVESFVEDYPGTSEPVARQWLRNQAKARGLAAEVRDAVPPLTYGGLWYDNQNRRIKVGLVAGTSPDAVNDAADDRGVGSLLDVVPVAHTAGQLEQAQQPLLDALESLEGLGLVQVSRNVKRNRLEIDVAASTTPAQRALIDDAADDSLVTVAVLERDEETLFVESQACRFPWCDSPLRGGVRIELVLDPDYWCTLGFNARAISTSAPRILTAGHCVDGQESQSWATRDSSRRELSAEGIGKAAGEPVNGKNGDAAAIAVDATSVFRPTARRRAVVFVTKATVGTTRRDIAYPIRRVGASEPGDRICQTGATHGTRCGEITRLGQKVETKGGKTYHWMGEARICGTTGGDSGAPLYAGNVAFGLHSSGFKNKSCITYYQGIVGAENLLGVRVALRR